MTVLIIARGKAGHALDRLDEGLLQALFRQIGRLAYWADARDRFAPEPVGVNGGLCVLA